MKLSLLLLLPMMLFYSCDLGGGKSNAYLVGGETKKVQELAFDAEAKYKELLEMIQQEIKDRIAGDNDLWAEIVRLDKRIDDLTKRVDLNSGRITENEKNIAILFTRVDLNSQHIIDLKADIEKLNDDLKEALKSIDKNSTLYLQLKAAVDKNTVDIANLNYKLDQHILEFRAKCAMIMAKFSKYTTLEEFNQFKIDQAAEFQKLRDEMDFKLEGLEINLKKWVSLNFTSQEEFNEFKNEYSIFYAHVMSELNRLSDLSKTFVTISEFTTFQNLINGKVEGLEDFIKNIENQVLQNKEDIITLTNNYEEIKIEVQKNTQNITLLNVNLAEFKTEILNYINVIKVDIEQLQTQVGDVNIAELYNEVQSIKQKQMELCQSLMQLNHQIAFLVNEIKRVEEAMVTNADLEELRDELRDELTALVESKTEIYDQWVIKFDQLVSHFGSVEEIIARLELVKQNEIRIQQLETDFADYKEYVSNTYATITSVQDLQNQIDALQEALGGKMNTCTQDLANIVKDEFDAYRVEDIIRLYSSLTTSQQYSSVDLEQRKLLLYNALQSFLVYHQVDLSNLVLKDKVDTLIASIGGNYTAITEALKNYRNITMDLSHKIINSLSMQKRTALYDSFRNFVGAYTTNEGHKCEEADLNLDQSVPGFNGYKGSVHEYLVIKWINSFVSLTRGQADADLLAMFKGKDALNDDVNLAKLIGILNSNVFKISYGETAACQEAITTWQTKVFADGADSLVGILKSSLLGADDLIAFEGIVEVILPKLSELRASVEGAFGHKLGEDQEFVSEYTSVISALVLESAHHQKYLALKLELDEIFAEIQADKQTEIASFRADCIDGFDKNSVESMVATNGTALQNIIGILMGSPLYDQLCPEAQDLLNETGALVGALPVLCDNGSGCDVIDEGPSGPACYPDGEIAKVISVKHGFHDTLGEGTKLCNGMSGNTLVRGVVPNFTLNNKCVAIYRPNAPEQIDNYVQDLYLYTKVEDSSGFKVTVSSGSTTVGEVNVDLVNQTVDYTNGDISDDDPIVVINQSQYSDERLKTSISHIRLTKLVKDLYDAKNNYLTNLCFNITPYNNKCSGEEMDEGSIHNSYCARVLSPIILDFGQIGYKTVPVQNGVSFDLDADGNLEKSGWIAPGANKIGFLAIDLNNNGQIDNGAELFGNGTELRGAKEKAANGYVALAQYDENNDGVINNQDKVFSKLKVWFDVNGNAKVDEGEFKTLAEKEVQSIAVNYENSKYIDGFSGNQFKYESTFKMVDGKERKTYDVFFATDAQNVAGK